MAYIPGVTGAGFRAGLTRDVRRTGEDQSRKARALSEYQNKRDLIQKWAGTAFKGLGLGVLGDVGGYGVSRLFSGKAPSMQPGVDTGLRGDIYKQLAEARGGIEKSMQGQLAGSVASTLLGKYGKKAVGDLKSGFGKLVGEHTGINIGAPSALGGGLTEDAKSFYESMGPSGATDILSKSVGQEQAQSGILAKLFGLGQGSQPSLPGGEGYGGFSGAVGSGDLDFASPLVSDAAYTPSPITYGGYGPPEAQQGGYLPQYQIGGALKRSFGFDLEGGSSETSRLNPLMQAFQAADLDRGNIMGQAAGRHQSGLKELSEIGRMKALESARKRVGENIQSAQEDLLGEVGGVKDTSSAMQNYLEGQKFFRQQDPANTPYGQSLGELDWNPTESLSRKFTGEPLDDSEPSYWEGKLGLMESGLGYRGSDEERMDESVTFPEGLYQDESEPESKSWMQRLLGRQMGGMMPGGVSNPLPYNLGGVAENKRSRLSSLLGMLSGAGRRQKAYEEMVPQDMIPMDESEKDMATREMMKLIDLSESENTRGFMRGLSPEEAHRSDILRQSIFGHIPETQLGQGYQEGGYMPRYNLGGSVTQQPMAYQLGGLLKYRRSPFG